MKNIKLMSGSILMLLMLSLTGYGQKKYAVSGKVTDGSGSPVFSGTVSLIMSNDSAKVTKAVLNDGKFSYASIQEGDYLLKISCIGFNDELKTLALHEDKNIAITLKENPTALKEVQISGSKKMFSNKNGNITVNIENSILSSIPNTIDLLAKLPAIQISPDRENINVVGRGEPLIYLDNQKIKMNDLTSLSANDIKTIEIINHPSAKYEAEGNAVILITRKTNKTDGMKIDLTETASYKRFFQNRAGLNVSLKKGRLEFKGNLQYNYLNLWESNGNDFRIKDKNLVSDYTVTSIGLRKQTIVGGGVYYQINDNDYLSFNASKKFQYENFTISTNSSNKNASAEDEVVTHNYNNSSRPLFNSNINYNRKFKELNGQLFIGGQYSQSGNNLNSNIWNNYNNTETVLTQDRQQKYLVDLVSGRADFEKSFQNEIKWETGGSISEAKSNSILNMQNYSPKNNTGSDYDFSEKIEAAYTQLSGKIKKVSYSAGLRMENTRVHGGYRDSIPLLVNKNYTDFFPKGNITISVGHAKTLTLEYAKSISRPDYSTSSQITTYINPFFEWSQNINIAPSKRQEISATVQYKESSWGVSYYRINNPVYYSAEYDDQNSTLRMINKNYALESGINLTATVPLKYKCWSSTNMLVATKDQVKDPAAIVSQSKPYLYFYSNNQFKLPDDFTFMVSGWGITKRNEGVFDRNAMYAIDTAITKTFKKKLSLSLNYNSFLGTRQAKENFTVNNVMSNGIYYSDVREISMSVKYAFGKLKDSKYKSKEVDNNINRMR